MTKKEYKALLKRKQTFYSSSIDKLNDLRKEIEDTDNYYTENNICPLARSSCLVQHYHINKIQALALVSHISALPDDKKDK